MESAESTAARPAASVEVALRRVESLVRLWDEAVRLPILGWKVGLDAIVGLVPGAGDLIGALVSSWVVLVAARLGVGTPTLLRMALNVGIDALVGAVPFLGDLFDIGWKANRRNYDLLQRWRRSPDTVHRSSTLVVAGLGAALLGMVGLIGWLTVALFDALRR
jgi:hypothetical protein